MRAVVQRVLKAAVTVRETGRRAEIGPGLVVLLGVAVGDGDAAAAAMAEKAAGLRIFEDEDGKMNRALTDIPGSGMLIVSQFTLAADTRKGRRPSFTNAAPPELARPLYEKFVHEIQKIGVPVETGDFGAEMLVEIANDGPVTFILEI